ncbi:hypothetical protein X777_11277 [Ooceraea biroi]|uniref:Uncharacterized protein n=1 Tax=Ooceraea biroi TaxID=2015173 RepID=A0A026W2U2_OOCBI|nr:hypothetical protein X777_11277 [Ooceraea biroi]
MLKRKREEALGGVEGDKEEIFRDSKKTQRSPGGKAKEGEADRRDIGDMRGWDEKMKEMISELREVLREDIRRMEEEVKGEIRAQGKQMREEVEDLRREMKEQEELGRKERQEINNRLEKVEKEMKELKEEKRKEREEGKVVRGMKRDNLIENVIDREREERRKNVVIRGVEVKEGKRVEAVKEVLEKIGARGEIRKCKKIGEDKGKGKEMILVKLDNEEQKREIMSKKSNLRGREERVMDDWTWKERRMRWRLEEIARGGKQGEESMVSLWKNKNR